MRRIDPDLCLSLLGFGVVSAILLAYYTGHADGYDEGARDGYESCASAEVS